MPTLRRAGQVDNGVVTPEEAARVRASVEGKEQAPSSKAQAGQFVNWNRLADTLGQPFEIERIPVSRLRTMRRDHMLGFGLAFIKTPIIRAKWFINARDNNGPNAQVAANVDWALRRIYSSFVHQWCLSLDFGFSAIAKRWELRMPTGTFIQENPESGEREELPIWSEGNIEPVVFKPFVAMPPEYVQPIWNGKGEFDGIQYTAPRIPGQDETQPLKVDLAHALWATNEKEQNFGSIFGFARTGYAYRPWWSYWFRWAILDRAFETRGDPATIVRHPEGNFENEDGTQTPHVDYALEMGERIRSGATVALPSEVYLGEIDGKPSATPMWDIEFLKDGMQFDNFQETFADLDVMKLRSLWIPEQTFLEGRGGTSSRNVAGEMGSHFVEQQSLLAYDIRDTLNRWVIPQFLAVNFPEFLDAGGSAEMVVKGFADQDVEFTKQIIQLVGQQESGQREMLKLLDLQQVLEDAGMPLRTFAAQQRREAEIADEQAALAGGPPAAAVTAPVPGSQVGIVPSATGFSYIQPRERIVFQATDKADSFVDSLPDTRHYSDAEIRRAARKLWKLWRDEYEEAILRFSSYLESLEGVEAADEEADAFARAKRIVDGFEGSPLNVSPDVATTESIFNEVIRRSSALEAKKASVDAEPEDDRIKAWVEAHIGEMVANVTGTNRKEWTTFLARRLEEGETSPSKLALELRSHFGDFPDWKADRLARSEIRDAYNAGTILTGEKAGLQLQAIDATDGEHEPECLERDGQLMTADQAIREREHPNGTLGFRLVPVELSVKYYHQNEDDPNWGRFEPEEATVYMAFSAAAHEQREFIKEVVDEVCRLSATTKAA